MFSNPTIIAFLPNNLKYDCFFYAAFVEKELSCPTEGGRVDVLNDLQGVMRVH